MLSAFISAKGLGSDYGSFSGSSQQSQPRAWLHGAGHGRGHGPSLAREKQLEKGRRGKRHEVIRPGSQGRQAQSPGGPRHAMPSHTVPRQEWGQRLHGHQSSNPPPLQPSPQPRGVWRVCLRGPLVSALGSGRGGPLGTEQGAWRRGPSPRCDVAEGTHRML